MVDGSNESLNYPKEELNTNLPEQWTILLYCKFFSTRFAHVNSTEKENAIIYFGKHCYQIVVLIKWKCLRSRPLLFQKLCKMQFDGTAAGGVKKWFSPQWGSSDRIKDLNVDKGGVPDIQLSLETKNAKFNSIHSRVLAIESWNQGSVFIYTRGKLLI